MLASRNLYYLPCFQFWQFELWHGKIGEEETEEWVRNRCKLVWSASCGDGFLTLRQGFGGSEGLSRLSGRSRSPQKLQKLLISLTLWIDTRHSCTSYFLSNTICFSYKKRFYTNTKYQYNLDFVTLCLR